MHSLALVGHCTAVSRPNLARLSLLPASRLTLYRLLGKDHSGFISLPNVGLEAEIRKTNPGRWRTLLRHPQARR